ncbi:hypothetical protein ACLKA6_007067 [Drosophila palustris]
MLAVRKIVYSHLANVPKFPSGRQTAIKGATCRSRYWQFHFNQDTCVHVVDEVPPWQCHYGGKVASHRSEEQSETRTRSITKSQAFLTEQLHWQNLETR